MIEKLKAYRAELEQLKLNIETEDNTAIIEEQVEVYKTSLIEADIKDKELRLAKVDSDINCISALIAREEAEIPVVLCEATPRPDISGTVII